MNDKLKLLEAAYTKATTNSEFIAYFLSKYSEMENIQRPEIISLLGSSTENYLKLGLCRAPKVDFDDYPARLAKISEFTGVKLVALNQIIRRVNTISMFKNVEVNKENVYLMAARDKNEKKD